MATAREDREEGIRHPHRGVEQESDTHERRQDTPDLGAKLRCGRSHEGSF